jgi:hypothetical protein
LLETAVAPVKWARESAAASRRKVFLAVGLLGILILWRGLGLVFPDNADAISFTLRYLRYSLVGFWVSAGAPWLFFRFKLANAKM